MKDSSQVFKSVYFRITVRLSFQKTLKMVHEAAGSCFLIAILLCPLLSKL